MRQTRLILRLPGHRLFKLRFKSGAIQTRQHLTLANNLAIAKFDCDETPIYLRLDDDDHACDCRANAFAQDRRRSHLRRNGCHNYALGPSTGGGLPLRLRRTDPHKLAELFADVVCAPPANSGKTSDAEQQERTTLQHLAMASG